MAILGMTGFGRAEGSEDWGRWVWEARSVNGKNVDIRLNTPSGLDALDYEARARIKAKFKRGSFQVSLQLELAEQDTGIQINTRALTGYARRARIMSQVNGAAAPSFTDFLNARGVASSSGRRSQQALGEEAQEVVLSGLDQALEALVDSRKEEGASLGGILTSVLDDMQANTAAALTHADAQPGLVRERFVRRLEALASENEVSEEKLAQEVAVHAAKADVREELDRLAAHIQAGRDLLASEGAKGRKLDFLSQEMNREANTLCSKSASLELTNAGLALKSNVDQFREQVQNVE